MTTATLADLIARHGVEVLGHLDREASVPVLGGLQFQGDLAVIPAGDVLGAGDAVPPEGIPVIPAAGSGHEHRLLASAAATARFTALAGGQDLGRLECSAAAWLAHPEHGYLGIAPGTYLLRRQREQAQEERLVAD